MRVRTRGATSRKILIAAITVAVATSTLVAQRGASPAPPSAPTRPYALAWTAPLELSATTRLAMNRRMVFAAHDAGVTACDKATGKELWTRSLTGIRHIAGL